MTVMACGDLGPSRIARILRRFGLAAVVITPGKPIPGSYWGEPEAGLIDNRLFLRIDTPVHSTLHEACHWICMDTRRRGTMHTDAGGDVAEENAVCYLQVLLADEIHGFGRWRLFADLDAWGYSFRLGSARAWFERDAGDARDWLIKFRLIDDDSRPTWRVRG